MTRNDTHAILILAFYFPPMGMGGVQRPLKFARYLPECGWDVTVIAPEPGDYYHYDASLLEELPSSVRIERVRFFHPMYWTSGVGGREPVRRPAWKTAVRDWLRWPDEKRGFVAQAVKRARHISRRRPFDIVWTTSPPPSSHLAGLRLGHTSGWIADFRDPWFLAENDWGPTPLHAMYNRRLHRRIVRGADGLVAVNDTIAAACDRLGPRRPTLLLHNGYDESDFTPPLEQRGETDRLTIVCPGTFGQNTNPDPIFNALRCWRESEPELRMRIIHAGATLTGDPVARVRHHNLDDIYEERGYLNHRSYLQTIRSADILILGVNEQEGFRGNVPGRLFELLRTLRPVLFVGPVDGAVARLLGGIAGCRSVAPGDVKGACRALSRFAASPVAQPVRTMASIRHFERRSQARRLAELCTQVVTERRQGHSS